MFISAIIILGSKGKVESFYNCTTATTTTDIIIIILLKLDKGEAREINRNV